MKRGSVDKVNREHLEEELNEIVHSKTIFAFDDAGVSDSLDVHCIYWVDAVYHVDTVQQVFEANVVVRYRWKLTKDQAVRYSKSPGTFKLDKYKDIHPRFKIPNLKELSEWKEYPKKFEESNGSGEVYCETSFRVVGTFMEKMELESFPFDLQDLTITLVCNVPTSIYTLVPDSREKEIGIMREKFLTMSEWSVETLSVEFTQTNASESRSRSEKSVMRIFVKIRRKWRAYFWRVIFIMAIINFCSLYVFCIGIDEPGDRGGHIFTIMLTAVAFQFVIQSELPKLPYLTFLDYYILSAYAFIGGVAVENFYLSFENNEDADLDRRIFWIDLVVWAVLHILFVLYARYCISCENSKLRSLPIERRSNIVWKVPNTPSNLVNKAYWGRASEIGFADTGEEVE